MWWLGLVAERTRDADEHDDEDGHQQQRRRVVGQARLEAHDPVVARAGAPTTITSPSTSSALAKIEPMIEVCATTTSPAASAKSTMKNSGRLPSVDCSTPVTAGPKRSPTLLGRERHDPGEAGQRGGCGREGDQAGPSGSAARLRRQRRPRAPPGAGGGSGSRLSGRRHVADYAAARGHAARNRSGQSGSRREDARSAGDSGWVAKSAGQPTRWERVEREKRRRRGVRAQLDELGHLLQPEKRVGEPVGRAAELSGDGVRDELAPGREEAR